MRNENNSVKMSNSLNFFKYKENKINKTAQNVLKLFEKRSSNRKKK